MEWLVLSILFSVALAMDCFVLSVTDGLTLTDLLEKKRRPFFIAGIFGLFQGLFPLIGFLLGEAFSSFIDSFDHWIALALLTFIGGKMLIDGIKGLVKPESREPGKFSVKTTLLQGVADSIDALAIGITIRTNIGATADWQIYVCLGIIALTSFLISLVGLFAGKGISKLLRGKYEIANIIGGVVLILLGVFICLEGVGVISWGF